MTDTKEIQTEYGTVEVETVECDSCGNTIGKEEAYRFAMDSTAPNKRMNDAERSGYACSLCVDNGPISFPESHADIELTVTNNHVMWFIIIVITGITVVGVLFL